MKTILRLSCALIVLLLIGGRDVHAQASANDRLIQQILDAEAIQQSAEHFAFLTQERAALNQLLDQAAATAGFRRDMFPIETRPLEGEVLKKTTALCADLNKWMLAMRSKLKENQAQVKPADFPEADHIRSLHPGSYYLGLNSDHLCDLALRDELYMLQLQDYPFEDAAADDDCLWDLAGNAPNLGYLVAFACDISNEVLTGMHLEKLSHLHVLDLAENSLTAIEPGLFAAGSIRSLDLSKNRISKLPADLAPLKALVYLNLRGNPIDATEKARILKALPGTVVVFE